MTVRRFGAWRLANGCLVLMACTVVGAWLHRVPNLNAPAVWVTALLLVVLSLSIAALAWRLQPLSLRWDTQRWHWGGVATAGQEPHTGRLTVALDLGGWMLLHLIPDDATVLHSGTWLPVQRRGHEAAWHALRCTVYCARPVSLPTVAPF